MQICHLLFSYWVFDIVNLEAIMHHVSGCMLQELWKWSNSEAYYFFDISAGTVRLDVSYDRECWVSITIFEETLKTL